MSTKRIKLVVQYDGTDFRGWAAQAGQRTVQGTLKEFVLRATGEDVEIVGASRTDAGAHATGQVCHFDTGVRMDAQKWARVLNRVLPTDVSVSASEEAGPDFHSRFCAEWRLYRYRIRTAARDPFHSRYVHDHGRTIDVKAMRTAGDYLLGEHDFLAYTEELEPSVENTTRKLIEVNVEEADADEVRIEIKGTAFLKGMMRRISGALLEVGRGHRKPEEVGILLTPARNELQWPVVLPAKGLTLLRVHYSEPPIDHRTDSNRA